MMPDYVINCSYNCSVSSTVEFPEPYDWDDVDSFFVKWDTLYLFMKDESEHKIELNTEVDASIGIDWKRPDNVFVYNENYEEIHRDT